MAKSSVRLETEETWLLLDKFGAWSRDTRTVQGFHTGHEAKDLTLDTDTALSIKAAIEAMAERSPVQAEAVMLFFVGQKRTRRLEAEKLVFDYYAPLYYPELAKAMKKSRHEVMMLVASGVSQLQGMLMPKPVLF